MRIVILGLNYLPESTSIGPYTADLAEYLHHRGHQVQVITGFPSAPQWRVWQGYRGRFWMREQVNQVPVFRVWMYVPRNPRSVWRRVLFDSSFAFSAFLKLLFTRRADCYIVISPPLQLASVVGWLGRLRRIPVLLQIKDLVPDAAAAVGAMNPQGRAYKIAAGLEKYSYRRAAKIGVICEGMRQNLLAKSIPLEKIELLPDYIDLRFMQLRQDDFRHRVGIGQDQWLAMYSGSVAGKQGLETWVQAGEILDHDRQIVCCLVGEGAYLADLQNMASQRGLKRFRFLPLSERAALPGQLAAADCLIITQRAAVRDMVFPGKLLYYMAAGRPMVASVHPDSETGRFIREHQVGIVIAAEDHLALANAVRALRADPALARQLGANGRRVAEELFDREKVLLRFEQVISQMMRVA